MAQTIKLKRSSVSGNTPSTSDLELGEVAINTYDGKMFIKKNDGSDSIVEIGGSSGTVTDAFKTIAVSGQTSVVADSATDTLTLVAGTNMSITTNATGDSITFASTGSSGSATFLGLSDTPANFTGAAGKYLKVNSSGNSIEFDSLTFSDLASTPTTIAGYGITDALQLGTSATTALAGNTSIPSTLTDLSISDGSNGQVLQTDGSGNFSFVNQTGGNSFGTIAVSGQSNVVADQGSDTLTLVAGSNVTLTTNASGDSVTIASTGGSGTTAADAIFEEYQFTATSGQTTFTGSDDNSETLSYTANAIQVYLNGIFLDPSVDYTATNGTSIVLAETVDANDYLQVVAYKKKISDGQTTVDTFSGNGSTTAFTLSLDPGDENNTRVFIDGVYQSKSNYSVSGTTLTFATAPPNGTAVEVEIGNRVVTLDTTASIDLPDNVKMRLGTSQDLEIFHDGNNSRITDTGTGSLILRGANSVEIESPSGEDMAVFRNNAQAELYYDNNKKFETTNTGVTISGTAVTDLIQVKSEFFLGSSSMGKLTQSGSSWIFNTYASGAFGERFRITDTGVTTTGTSTADAFTFDNYTLDNNRISTNQSGGYNGDIMLDAAGDIKLDAAGRDIYFAQNGTSYFQVYNDLSNNTILNSPLQDKDIKFTGNDGGTTITALTLDMSDGGAATFNNDIFLSDGRAARFGNNQDFRIYNDGSHTSLINATVNQDILFRGNDDGSMITALTLDMSNAGKATFSGIVSSAIGFERGNLFITENEIDVSSGNLTLDVAGNINLDADNSGNVYLRDDGVAYGRFHKTNNNWVLKNVINEGDILFQGKDSGGSELTALTLDMSDAGAAIFNGHGTFNDTVTINSTSTSAVTVSGSGGGINLTGGNNRIYFGGQRAMEGITSNGNIQIGEGFSGNLLLQMNTEVQGNLSLADNKILRLGSDTDLQIYHSSTESWIKDTGSGSLYIDTDGPSIQLTSGNSAKNMVQAVKDGAVNLFYNNSQKLATSSSGVSVTGQLTATSDFIAADSGGTARGYLFGTSAGLFLRYNSGSNLQIQEAGSTRVIVDGSNVGISVPSPDERLHVSGGGIKVDGAATMASGAGTGLFLDYSNNVGRITALDQGVAWRNLRLNAAEHEFYIAGGLQARIDGSGNLMLGGATANDSSSSMGGQTPDLYVPGYTSLGGLRIKGTDTGNTIYKTGGTLAIAVGDSSTIKLNHSGGTARLNSGNWEVLDGKQLRAYRSGNSAYGALFMDTGENLYIRNSWANKDIVFKRTGEVGIGNSSPDAFLEVDSGQSGTPTSRFTRGLDGGRIQFAYGSNNTGLGEIGQTYHGTGRTKIWIGANLNSFSTAHNSNPNQQDGSYASWFSTWNSNDDEFTVNRIASNVTTPLLTVDSSGNLLVGTTNTTWQSQEGLRYFAGNSLIVTRDSDEPMSLNRLTNDGNVLNIRKDGTYVGGLQTRAGVVTTLVLNPASGNGAGISGGTKCIVPADEAGIVDNDVSLGITTHRFKDIHMSGELVKQYRTFYNGSSTSAQYIKLFDQNTHGRIPGKTLHFRAYAYNHSEHSIEVRVDIPTYSGFVSAYGSMQDGQGCNVEIIAGGLSTQTNIFKEIIIVANLAGSGTADGTEVWLKIQPPHSTTVIALKEFAESVPITVGTSDWTTSAPSNVEQTYPIKVGGHSINNAEFGMDQHLNLERVTAGDSKITLKSTSQGDPTLHFDSAAANRNAVIRFMDQGSFVGGRIQYNHNGDRMDFQAGSSTGASMSLSNQMLGIGTTLTTGLAVQNSAEGVQLTAGGRIFLATNEHSDFNRTANGEIFRFRRSITQVGSISLTTSGTSYNETSDRRIKENIQDAGSASTVIDNIQVRSFDWKTSGEHRRYGMIAQELVTVAPEAVTVPENEEDMMGVDYSKLVPMLVKGMQEQTEIINDLRARVAQLEKE